MDGPGRRVGIAALQRRTLSDHLADEIRHRILRGAARAGERIGPMRILAAELGVSLAVVREAMSRLKGEGFVDVRPGSGTFVARRVSAARALRAARRRASRAEVEQLRLGVEPAVARAAARRATTRDLTELHFALLEREFASTSPAPEYTRTDMAFHLAVAKAAGSGLAVGLHRMGAVVLGSELAIRARAHAANSELRELHRALFEAIETGSPGKAERAARAIAAIEARPP
jgi:DNA-binding FadR family transcriptional regulator